MNYDIEALQEFVFTPFEEEHNVTIELDLGRDGDRYTKLKNEIDITDIDVFLATQATAQKGIEDGLFASMNKADLKNYDSLFELTKNPNGETYGPSYTVNRLRVAGNSDNIPSTWAEILADHDSKVAIPHMTSTFGPMVLYGAGEVSGDASENIAAIESWVSSGKVHAYVSTFSTRRAVINGEFDYALLADFGYTPDLNWGDLDKVMLNSNTVNIVKGSKNSDLAMEFIDFLLSEQVQKESLDRGIDSPVNKNVKFEESQENVKTNLASFPNAVITDIGLVNENRATWVAKWNELFTE
ncbi:extracellular solute-binding protein [Vibrio sp. TH_r3]|uniref:extracellular solute-binding protein n=1 Tax=Vibrio sp. TH_r3 TaxID=3082084 RepID=UPI002953DECC|nr:extracellular solute-binding protein [Vibrio sp. TH_r3]MDV7105568.1 extracellular solute-binding protein [Vibrio sp. TH_r3]